MLRDCKIFIVYPSFPEQIGKTISIVEKKLSTQPYNLNIQSWKQLDIPGKFIADEVLDKIRNSNIIIADITYLNFNVTFEIGFSIGCGKIIYPIIDKSLSPQEKELNQLGIFDTIGYQSYSNSNELITHIESLKDLKPAIFQEHEINKSTPLYLLDTLHKTECSIRIKSKIKKARMFFRSFDPREHARLSTLEAYRNIKQSIAVVVHLISSLYTDHRFNNLRGAFIAGLAYGLGKETLILQEGEEPVPLDYRDFVSIYKDPKDIDRYINDLAPQVTEGLQVIEGKDYTRVKGLLANLDLGATAAENEMINLGHYYVPIDIFNHSLQGTIRLAVGRKGSGKTALFFQVRDYLRREKKKIVLDLKPEGHQLKRFKDTLSLLGESVSEHVSVAFWEYALLLEICHKVLEKDKKIHIRDHNLYEPYRKLESLYSNDAIVEEADFSERMLVLVKRINTEYERQYSFDREDYLTTGQVNELIYKHDIPELRNNLLKYLKLKDSVWLLFDNIDKGWPTRGVEYLDAVILRSLLDATRKLERFFRKNKFSLYTIVFVRNDVYELLVDETPDRGKEAKASLDWTDRDLLKELLRRRLVYNGLEDDIDFDTVWRQISISHIEGEDSADFLIDRSLMRPRNFLSLVNYCKSNAVNLKHDKINESDIKKAWSIYSADIVRDISLEIRDVYPKAEDVLYYFIGSSSQLTLSKIKNMILSELSDFQDHINDLIEILYWFGFLGIYTGPDEDDEIYIYNVHYDMKKMKALTKKYDKDDMICTINKGFWPFLEINTDD